MVYLIWSLLNIGLIIYFLTICIKVIKLVREKMGLFVTLFFVFTLLSFIGNDNKDMYSKSGKSDQTETWHNSTKDSITFFIDDIQHIKIEDNLVTSYYLEVLYGKDSIDNVIPLSAFTTTNGLSGGTKLIPKSIQIYKSKLSFH